MLVDVAFPEYPRILDRVALNSRDDMVAMFKLILRWQCSTVIACGT